jgi:hypothetical protein
VIVEAHTEGEAEIPQVRRVGCPALALDGSLIRPAAIKMQSKAARKRDECLECGNKPSLCRVNQDRKFTA